MGSCNGAGMNINFVLIQDALIRILKPNIQTSTT